MEPSLTKHDERVTCAVRQNYEISLPVDSSDAENTAAKRTAHALTSALPVCTCGSVAQINLVVPLAHLAVCQLVVVNQQPQMKEERTTITKKVCRR